MKFENNNKEVIRRLTNKSIKKNRVRNIFAILAIILTTFMISSVFSIGSSYIKNYTIMNYRMQGNTATTFLNNPTQEQMTKLKELDLLKSLGYQINVGMVESEKLKENQTKIVLQYNDKVDFQQQLTPSISNIEGNYPNKTNEVMASRRALELLGINNAQIGDKVNIEYKSKGEVKKEEFVFSGFFTDYNLVNNTGYLLVSENFINANKFTLENNGIAKMTIKDKMKQTAPDIIEDKIKVNKGQEFSYNYDRNSDLGSTKLATGLLGFIVIAFIILSGYLLIYNVIYIAVIKEINFYGLLKTIGTSPKQIKRIVRGQVLKLSIIGIPIGLLLGSTISFAIVPMAMNMFVNSSYTAMPKEISFNPLIFIGSAVFSLVTVILSCRKPAKIASAISPTEALKYTGITNKKDKKNRNTTNGGRLYKMAWYNVFREKKRALLVFLSLFIGITTFLNIRVFIDSIDVENYLSIYVPNDFEIQNIELQDGVLDNKLIDRIKALEGVENTNRFTIGEVNYNIKDEVIDNILTESLRTTGMSDEDIKAYKGNKVKEELVTKVMGVDDSVIEEYNNRNDEKIDLEKFKNGEISLIVTYPPIDKSIIDNKSLTLNNKEFKSKYINDSYSLFPSSFPIEYGLPYIYISNEQLSKLNKDTVNYLVNVDVKAEFEDSIEGDLKSIVKERGLYLESKSDTREQFKGSSMIMAILGGGISVILILIGILNFINVMITGVYQRLKELAILESIGMTKKQIKKMLTFEGLYYAGITSALILTVGTGIIYLVGELTQKIVHYAEFKFPGIYLLLLIIMIFVICITIPALVFKVSVKKSVTERIRETEE